MFFHALSTAEQGVIPGPQGLLARINSFQLVRDRARGERGEVVVVTFLKAWIHPPPPVVKPHKKYTCHTICLMCSFFCQMATSPCSSMDLLEWKTTAERTHREENKTKQAEQKRTGDEGGWVSCVCLLQ